MKTVILETKPYSIFPVEFATPAFDETIRLRAKILKTPLGLSFTEADFTNEYQDIHLAYYNEQFELLACLVLEDLGDGILKMRQVAVDEGHQGKGIGTRLVKASEILAKEKGFEIMALNARDTAIPFYERLNYQKIGDEFIEVNIPHFKMTKSL